MRPVQKTFQIRAIVDECSKGYEHNKNITRPKQYPKTQVYLYASRVKRLIIQNLFFGYVQ